MRGIGHLPESVRKEIGRKAALTRLRNRQIPILDNKEEGICLGKVVTQKELDYIQRGYKAKETREKNYNLRCKNEARKIVIDLFSKIQSSRVLCLETSDFFFVNSLKKHSFIIYERDKDTFERMLSNRPENVEFLINKDVSDARFTDFYITAAWLDYCSTFEDNFVNLGKLSEITLARCHTIALTFSLRKNKKEIDDYKIDLYQKMNRIFPQYEIISSHSYRDGCPMIQLVLSSKEKNPGEIPKRYYRGRHEELAERYDALEKYVSEECKKKGRELFGFYCVVNRMAVWNFIPYSSDYELLQSILDNMPEIHRETFKEIVNRFLPFRDWYYEKDKPDRYRLHPFSSWDKVELLGYILAKW